MVDCDQYDQNSLRSALKDFVNSEALARAWQSFSDGKDAEQIHAAIILAVWLRENEKRPVVPG